MQRQLAEFFCVSFRTVEEWEYRNNCLLYTKLMVEECLSHDLPES